MRKTWFAFAWLIVFIFMSVNVAISAEGKLSGADKKFVENAAMGGMLEVKLGEVAKEKAQNPDVKAFGERMVKDHSAINDKLRAVAEKKGIKIPDQLDKKHQEWVDTFSKMDAKKFDKEYMDLMVKDHKRDVEAFQKEAKEAEDPQVKEFASTTLPTLKDHFEQAKKVKKELGEKKK